MKKVATTQPTTSATLPRTFGETLRRYRLARGLTQAALAERAGLSPRGVNDLERGARTHPRRDTIALLADALGLSDEERAGFAATIQRTPTKMRVALPTTQSAPSGTVTFLFTDIEGSTRLLQRLGDDYAALLDAHGKLLRKAFAEHHGYEVDTQGDSFFAVFPTVGDALAAATQAQRALASHHWPAGATVRVRMGLHTGAPTLIGGRYIGMDVHRAARVGAAAHGGQALLSSATAELARGAPESLPEGADLRDLGVHRLKDLQAPERLWQLLIPRLPDAFPPPRALDTHLHNLPIQPTELLGREREVGDIARLLREEVRLVTVIGPPGVGKTRLSLQVAAKLVTDVACFPDGVWLVRLSRLADPALVIPAIAQELGLREGGARIITEILRDYLVDKRLLLLLDNFEHVAAAATALAETLAHAPGVHALVTSRAPLHLRGERVFALSALTTPAIGVDAPTLDQLASYASVNLFTERAHAAHADFTLTTANAPAIAAICARLEGLPLALELAAVRVKLLSPEALRDRLQHALPLLTGGARDADERQRTMRATLAWSEALLAPTERALFRRLAVFAGGATLATVEDVCLAPAGAEPLDLDALDGLATLVDHSLVQWREEAGESRFGLHHVVREYAMERLEAAGEAEALRRAHAQWLARMAEEPGPLAGVGNVAWLARMQAEQDNLRAALGWVLEQGEVELGLRLGTGTSQLWFGRGMLHEGRRWLERLLQYAEKQAEKEEASQSGRSVAQAGSDIRRKRALGWVLHYTGLLALNMGDWAAAESLFDRALTCGRRTDDEAQLAMTLHGLAYKPGSTPTQTHTRVLESLALARHSGNEAVLAAVLAEGDVANAPDHQEQWIAMTYEGLDLARRLGDINIETNAHQTLAELAAAAGDLDGVRIHALNMLQTAVSIGYDSSVAIALDALATVACAQGRTAHAARMFGASGALFERTGQDQRTFGIFDPSFKETLLTSEHARFGNERWSAEVATGRAMMMAQAIEEGLREARDEPE